MAGTGGHRRLPLVIGCLLLATTVAVASPPPKAADAYAATDLPAMPTYCHPNVSGVPWPDQVPGCSIGFTVSSSYPPLDEGGTYHEYGGPVISRLTIPVTNYGSASSPPTFVLTADYGKWQDDGLRRVEWKRLTWYPFLPGDTTSFYADPVTTCGLKATSCTYRFDAASLGTAVGLGLGNPPAWLKANINIPVQHAVSDGDGQATYAYGQTSVAIGFYKTDNKTPVANFNATPNPGSAISYHFDGRGSSDPDGESIARYVWDFGDGSLAAEGAQVDHTYAAAGNYRVTLRALDVQGAQGTTFKDLKRQLAVSNLAISKVPTKVGDQFDLTATLRNDSADAMPCVSFFSNIDIRPVTSFTKISGPATLDPVTLARGATVSKTWRYELKAPVPATFDVYPSGSGGGGTDCANTFDPTTVNKKFTFTIGAAQPWAPFANWGAFVKRQYTDITGKEPSSSNLSSWVAKLTAGTSSPGDLDAALRLTTDNTTNVDPTARLYRALLARTPDKGGLVFWIGRRRGGEWTLTRMADSFASSTEFKAKYGSLTNRQFVTRIYTDVLGRTADPSGVDYWTRKLDSKSKTRGGVMVGFSESNEYKTKQVQNTDASVGYIFLLGRSPTSTELSNWVTRQKAGTTNAVLLGELLASPAYATRITG